MHSGTGFGDLLRLLRLAAAQSQESLARQARLGVRTISDLERGRASRPHSTTVNALADALDLSDEARSRFVAAAFGLPPGDGRQQPGTATPRQLPPDLADFTGREPELAALAALATADDLPNIVTIVGMGGVGKTTLAIHAATALAPCFPDGQLYFDLHGFDDATVTSSQALERILRTLGIPDARIPSHLDDLAGLYRSYLDGKRMLILLDNATDEAHVRPLLSASRQHLTLVTSRNHLGGIDGAATLRVATLPADEAAHLLHKIAGRLRDDPVSTRRVVELCDGLALALRIVGSRIAARPAWSIERLAERLEANREPISEMEVGDRSVRACFDLSFRALMPEDQRLLACIAVLPGRTFDVDVVAAVTALPHPVTRRRLERLVDLSLLLTEGTTRYRLHDLIRAYAAELLPSDERIGSARRAYSWYVAAADAAMALTSPVSIRLPTGSERPNGATLRFRGREHALEWLESEYATLVEVITHAIDDAEYRYAWDLADALRAHFHRRRFLTDWFSVATKVLVTAQRHGGPAQASAAHLSLGLAHKSVGDYTSAATQYELARDTAHRAGWLDGEAAAIGNLGILAYYTGSLDTARECYEQVIVLTARTANPTAQAVASLNLGCIELQLDRLDAAAHSVKQAMAAYERVADLDSQAIAHENLADIHLAAGELDEALCHADAALSLTSPSGNRLGATLLTRARVLVRLGRFDEAERVVRDAAVIAGNSRDRQIQVDATTLAAAIACGRGDDPTAIGLYTEALRLAEEIALVPRRVEALLGLAGTYRRTGGYDNARQAATRALDLARSHGYRRYERMARQALAGLPAGTGRP